MALVADAPPVPIAALQDEVNSLRKFAALVVSWLLVITVLSLGLGVALLSGMTSAAGTLHNILLCVAAATLGSSISALVSAGERISHGWEFSDGKKYPADEPKDKFVARMIPLFVIRPFLGSAVGLLVYTGLVGGYLIAVQEPEQRTFNAEGLTFLAFLGGLFAKTLIEKLRAMFDTLFGK